MDDIQSKLSDLASLSEEEIAELNTQLTNQFQELYKGDRTPDVAEQIVELANAKKSLDGELSRRAAEAVEVENTIELAAEAFNSEDEDSEEVSEDEEAVDEEVTETANKDLEEEIPVIEEIIEEEIPVEEAPVETIEVVEEEIPAEVIEEVAEEVIEDETVAEDEEDEDEDLNRNFSDDSDSENENNDEVEETTSEELSVESEENVSDNVNTEFSAPEDNSPAVESAKVVTPVITAAADLRGLPMGSEIANTKVLAEALLDRRKGMGRTSGGDGEQALVASIRTDEAYGPDSTLVNGDTEGNMSKVQKVVDGLKNPDSLVAAGGLLGPVDTDWGIYELGETLGRPVKDSLPNFKAERGGLRFMTPPVLEDLNGAVSVWTLQDDIDALDNDGSETDKVKPCIRVQAGEEVTVYLEAMPLCLTFGNIGARAYPELVERHIALAMVWQARFAESRLLTRIGALSTQVTAGSELGAARDILVQLDTAAAGLRSRHRLDPNAPLQAIFPEWFRKALRADLVKQIPGDGQDAALGLTDATANKWFADRNINVTWTNDGESGQIFGAQGDGALVDFPSSLIWYLFPAGTFLFLEDATLDLGLVRDSTLNATNDYKMFLETFENVAKVGVESLRITTALKIAGASAGTVNTLA